MALPSFLSEIDNRQADMLQTVSRWANINSGSHNLGGLGAMAAELEAAFVKTGGEVKICPSEPMTVIDATGNSTRMSVGNIIHVSKRPQANKRVLLVGHMDTVFGQDSPFQSCYEGVDGKLHGPGTADMKGGLVVMLNALIAFENSPHYTQIGWDVLINADEEIGSHGSAALLHELGAKADAGMVYEPSMPDGTFAGARKGSGNFTVTVKGRAAHAGREHHLGRNAIAALARLLGHIDQLSGMRDGLTINIGKIAGGDALNVVPDLAQMSFNVRLQSPDDQNWLLGKLEDIIAHCNAQDGIIADLQGGFSRPPKPMTPALEGFFELAADCGHDLGIDVRHVATGGCCDGNNLAAAGLATIDTLGVCGANIHSDQEYMIIDSLTARAKLSALILHRLASNPDLFPNRSA